MTADQTKQKPWLPARDYSLFDKLDGMHCGEMWVDWWESAEMERRLRERPDTAARFSDLVVLKRQASGEESF